MVLTAEHAHDHHPAAQLERRLHRVAEAVAVCLHPLPLVRLVPTNHQPIHDRLYAVHLVAVKSDLFIHVVNLAIDAHPHIASLAQVVNDPLVLALAVANKRPQDHDAAVLFQAHYGVHNLLHRLPTDLSPTYGTVRNTHPGIEQAQIVIDLCDRAHGRAGAATGALLIDADSRGKTFDVIHIGLVHLAQKLSRVGRQRLDIPALTLRIDSVKG